MQAPCFFLLMSFSCLAYALRLGLPARLDLGLLRLDLGLPARLGRVRTRADAYPPPTESESVLRIAIFASCGGIKPS